MYKTTNSQSELLYKPTAAAVLDAPQNSYTNIYNTPLYIIVVINGIS